MASLEKKLYELLHELSQKRVQFEELQQRYDTELMKNRELETDKENLLTEMNTSRAHIDFTKKILHKCEVNYGASQESAVKTSLSLEAATKTIDIMKNQATRLHMENVKLKKRAEDLEQNMKTELFFRESCASKQEKIQTTIESLNTQVRELEKELRQTERHATKAISIGNQSELMAKHKDTLIAQLRARSEELSKQLVTLTSENRILQENLKERKPLEQHYVKDILEEWQASVEEMKTRTSSYENELDMLQNTLKNALDAQTKFQNLEAASSERVRTLEAKLQEVQKVVKKKQSDCSVQTDLKISMDIACETTRCDLASTSTQTDLLLSDDKQESTVTIDEGRLQNERNVPKSFSTKFIDNSMLSSSSLSELMTKFQAEKGKPAAEEISDLPTQINPNIPNT